MAEQPVEPSVGGDFEAFYRANVRGLMALGWSLTGDPDVAAELTQHALSEVVARWDHVQGVERPDLWVRRVLINTSAGRFRSLEREGRAVRRLGRPVTADALALSDSTLAFLELVRNLPDLQRRVVILHYLEDRSVADIAQVLDVTQGTVKTSLHRARTTLAARLNDEEEER